MKSWIDTAAQMDATSSMLLNKAEMTKSVKRLLLGTSFVASLCPAMASAHDPFGWEDPMVHPGAACQPLSSSSTFTRGYGRANNISTSRQTWICPVARQHENAGTMEYAQVTLLEGGYGKSNCSLQARDEAGVLIGSRRVDSSTSSGISRLVFGFSDPNAINVARYGPLYFTCDLAGRSSILNYRATENVGEN